MNSETKSFLQKTFPDAPRLWVPAPAQAGGLLLDAKHPVLFSVIVLVASNR